MESATNEQMAKKPRISISLDEEVIQWLSERAEKEVRSVSNFVEYLVIREMQDEKNEEQK